MAEDMQIINLHHLVFGVRAKKGEGYGIKAVSKGLGTAIYTRRLQGHYVPLRQDDPDFRSARMLLPIPSAKEVMLSVITKGGRDEYGRAGLFVNHTAVVPRGLLQTRKLTLAAVERAIVEFDAKNPDPYDEIEPISLDLTKIEPPEPAGRGLGKYITQPTVETFATRLMRNQANRTLLLCRESDFEQRIAVAYMLTELLDFTCGIGPISFLTEPPSMASLDQFNLVVSPRGIYTGMKTGWGILESDLEAATLKRIDGREDVYKMIEAAFS